MHGCGGRLHLWMLKSIYGSPVAIFALVMTVLHAHVQKQTKRLCIFTGTDTFDAERTTALFACCSLGRTRSTIFSASSADSGL